MGSAAQRIPAHILAAGRRGARPGEIEELCRLADVRRQARAERDAGDEQVPIPARAVSDRPISLEQCCRDLDARKREYQRRVDEALDGLHGENAGYRLHGIPPEVRERLITSVRREFLNDLEQFLRANPQIGSVEAAQAQTSADRSPGGVPAVGPELWCNDPHARRREFRRRIDAAMQDEYDACSDYRIHGIPKRVQESVRDHVERVFLDELRAFQSAVHER